ncbi:MAG: pseudouridine synthase [Pontixanthobacter sp.]
MSRLILLNKPYGVLSQFTGGKEGEQDNLAHLIDVPGVYPAGRLDKDSEGLLLLTDDGRLQARIAEPRYRVEKTYFAQVEGEAGEDALNRLRQGVELKDGMTKTAKAHAIEPPDLWDREPPIRYRKNVTDSWIALTISEGKNRQVRRMTAAVGLPTLRLVRWSVREWTVEGLSPGDWREVSA